MHTELQVCKCGGVATRSSSSPSFGVLVGRRDVGWRIDEC